MSETFPARPYRDHVLAPCFRDATRHLLEHYLDVDRAHTVMLAEQGIIDAADARQILAAVDGIDVDLVRRADYDGSVEDLFYYLQQEIAARCSDSDTAGRLHTARSRNDIDVTIYRLAMRPQALALIEACQHLHGVFLDLAAEHHEALMPAYTHTQPAQPTTIAHFLLAMAENTSRDIRRLQRACENLNHCPLGACAITTTGFPIDRSRTAQLLGFSGPTRNAYASIASVDYFTELLGGMSTLLINTGRFAQEFLLMAMMEFGVIRLPDGYVQASSIMPQKRNPVAIEHVRAIASKALGQTLGVLTSVHNTPFGDINDVEDDLQPLNFSALADAHRAVALLAHTLEAAEFDLALLARRAEENFITVTELADTLVRQDGLPFRVAHAVVADCVARATERAGDIGHDDLLAAAAANGVSVTLTDQELAAALSARDFVNVREIHGGPAPAETRAALAEQRERQADDGDWHLRFTGHIEDARQALRDAVRGFA